MKKLLFIFASLLLFISIGKAQNPNPIPSWGVPVVGNAVFLEMNKYIPLTDDKRDVNVESAGNATLIPVSNAPAKVYIKRLDGTITYGPYFVQPGESIRVRIDNKKWGVYVHTVSQHIISVWID